ncbi:MAG: HAMP domain-containing sensor histidine kinase [Planctomycetota bacterium]
MTDLLSSHDDPRKGAGADAGIIELLERLDEFAHRLAAAEDELARSGALAALGTLAGHIAHEVNNLMTPVVAYTRAARADGSDRELTARALEQAEKNAEAATSMSRAILSLASPGDRGSPDGSEREPVDVVGCFDEALRCLGGARSAGLRISVAVQTPRLPRADAVGLRQVMLNLVLNARRAMGRGGSLTLRVREGSTWNARGICSLVGSPPLPQDAVLIELSDSGPGIPGDMQDRLFEPFGPSRSASSGSGRECGTGLGLALCRRLVERWGGAIAVRTREGVGTSIELLLPAAADQTYAAA